MNFGPGALFGVGLFLIFGMWVFVWFLRLKPIEPPRQEVQLYRDSYETYRQPTPRPSGSSLARTLFLLAGVFGLVLGGISAYQKYRPVNFAVVEMDMDRAVRHKLLEDYEVKKNKIKKLMDNNQITPEQAAYWMKGLSEEYRERDASLGKKPK